MKTVLSLIFTAIEWDKGKVPTYHFRLYNYMKLRKIRYIILGNGEKCQKCGEVMQRRGHKEIPNKNWYYKKWDICLNPNCKMQVQHYDEFKSVDWVEAENNESFFRNL